MNRILFEREELRLPDEGASFDRAGRSEESGATRLHRRATVELVLTRDDPRFHHIRDVLHADRGVTLAAGIVNGPRAAAQLVETGRDELRLALSVEPEPTDDLLPAVCLLGHPRPIVLKRLLRDLASAGVAGVVVAGTRLGEKSYLASSVWEGDTIRRCLVDGAAQGGGTHLPEVVRSESIRTGLADADRLVSGLSNVRGGATVKLAFSNRGAECAMKELIDDDTVSAAAATIYAIGPERGFEERELAELRADGYTVVSLGSRVLRTETAAVIVAALLRMVKPGPG